MCSLRPDARNELRMIVDDEWHTGRFGKAHKFRPEHFDLSFIRFLGAELQDVNAALEKALSHSKRLDARHVSEIENAVEASVGESFHTSESTTEQRSLPRALASSLNRIVTIFTGT